MGGKTLGDRRCAGVSPRGSSPWRTREEGQSSRTGCLPPPLSYTSHSGWDPSRILELISDTSVSPSLISLGMKWERLSPVLERQWVRSRGLTTCLPLFSSVSLWLSASLPRCRAPVLCRCIPFACIYKVAGANGCSLDETRPSCWTCRRDSAPLRTKCELSGVFFLCPAQIYSCKSYFSKKIQSLSQVKKLIYQ